MKLYCINIKNHWLSLDNSKTIYLNFFKIRFVIILLRKNVYKYFFTMTVDIIVISRLNKQNISFDKIKSISIEF